MENESKQPAENQAVQEGVDLPGNLSTLFPGKPDLVRTDEVESDFRTGIADSGDEYRPRLQL
jgi:hypothetical protein